MWQTWTREKKRSCIADLTPSWPWRLTEGAVSFSHSLSHFNQRLYLLRLAPPAAEGELPRPIGQSRELTDGKGIWHVHNGGWSPDGKSLVYTRDTDQSDIYVIEGYR